MVSPGRPTPLRDVAGNVSIAVGVIGSLVTALVGYGILSTAESGAVTGLLGLVPGVVTGISTVVAAFSTARQGERHVTPLIDPVNSVGQRLVPVVGPDTHGKHERLA